MRVLPPESSKSVRKCKACLQPVKGHKGPYGLSKCQNIEKCAVTDSRNLEEQKEEQRVAAIQVAEIDIKIHNDFEEESETDFPCDLNNSSLRIENDAACDYSLLSNGEEFSKKIDSIVARLEESLLLNEKDDPEVSDENSVNSSGIDIRTILSGGHFCICHCPPEYEVLNCQCEGELLLDSSLSGQIKNVFIDPSSESQVDWEPHVKFREERWRKNDPAVIVLDVEYVKVKGVEVLEGNVTIKAAYQAEAKGGEATGVVTGSMSMIVEVHKKNLKNNFKNPIVFKPTTFQLIKFEDEE